MRYRVLIKNDERNETQYSAVVTTSSSEAARVATTLRGLLDGNHVVSVVVGKARVHFADREDSPFELAQALRGSMPAEDSK
jgi:hypothetical protein